MSKKAIIGFKQSVLAPITTDTATAYATGEPIHIPYAAEMSKSEKSSDTDVYADDELYASVKNISGMTATVRYRELDLALAADIGGGEYDDETQELSADYSEDNIPYMYGYMEELIEGKKYRTVQVLSTELNSIDLMGSPKTKENGVTIQDAVINLTFKKPKMPGLKPLIYKYHDTEAEAIAYLETAISLPTT